MKLNHINLTVQDVPMASTFFQTYFEFKPADSKPNDSLSVLTGTDGFILVLMHERLNQNGSTTYPDAFHIGFYLDHEEAVLAKFQELKTGGINLPQEPQRIRKTFGFYFNLQNIMIEITTPV
jgi:catechol 2,3-dioxygenase-like lactoylglutathione lyase family enzyme